MGEWRVVFFSGNCWHSARKIEFCLIFREIARSSGV